jgi:two-component system response regulator NreC
MRPARVLICDNRTLTRAGLTKLLAGRDGMEVVGEAVSRESCVALARELRPDVIVVVLSPQDDPGYAREAFTAGANGHVHEDGAAIRVADPLSDGEQDVLRLIALGHTNQEIADRLVISIRTVETRRARILQKLGLKGRAELVRYALDHGLLDFDRPHTAS